MNGLSVSVRAWNYSRDVVAVPSIFRSVQRIRITRFSFLLGFCGHVVFTRNLERSARMWNCSSIRWELVLAGMQVISKTIVLPILHSDAPRLIVVTRTLVYNATYETTSRPQFISLPTINRVRDLKPSGIILDFPFPGKTKIVLQIATLTASNSLQMWTREIPIKLPRFKLRYRELIRASRAIVPTFLHNARFQNLPINSPLSWSYFTDNSHFGIQLRANQTNRSGYFINTILLYLGR